ncbi:hypothetical protein V2A60_009471 [Cordyceps javanica]
MPKCCKRRVRGEGAADASGLLAAAAAGHNEQVKELMRMCDINHRDNGGRTALHWAAINRHYEVVKTLLGHRTIDIEILDCLGKPALHYAVHQPIQFNEDAMDQNSFLNDMWEERPNYLAIRDRVGRAVFHEMLDRGNFNQVVLHLRPEVELLSDASGRTTLHYAAKRGDHMVALRIIEHHRLMLTSAMLMARDAHNQTALHYAARCGHDYITRWLTEATVGTMNREQKRAALHVMAVHGHHAGALILLQESEVEDQHEEMGLILARSAATLPRDTKREDLLLWAAGKGHTATVQALLAHGADVSHKNDEGWTPLSQAIENRQDTTVRALLQAGAKFDEISRGCRALRRAVQVGHIATIQALLDAGAKNDQASLDDDSPLADAANSGHEAIVKLLLAAGASVNCRSGGRTALICAARSGQVGVVKLLLEEGAQVNQVDDSGQTALISAISNGHKAVIQVLLEAGAKSD